jgi:hypothetical protein
MYFLCIRNLDSAVGIATGYGLDDRGVAVRVPVGPRILSFRPALGSTQPPIQCLLGFLSPGVKWPGLEADYSPPASVEVKKNVDLYIHSPHAFMV